MEPVLCLWRDANRHPTKRRFLTEEEMWMDLIIPEGYDDTGRPFFIEPVPYKLEIVPIYDCEHDDKESGQDYKHYHRDYRYKVPEELLGRYKVGSDPRPQLKDYEGILMLNLELVSAYDYSYTSNSMIPSYTGMKLNCKTCPHRGFNLENTKAVNGIIKCPLHGTKIDEETLIVI